MSGDSLDPIVSIDETTYVHGVWTAPCGNGSIMVTLYRPADGYLLARGRVRIHADDKLIGSQDYKQAFQFRARRKNTKPVLFRRKVASKLRRTIRDIGSADDARALVWIPVHGDGKALVEALERAAERGVVDIAYQRFDREEGGGEFQE